MWRPMLMLTLIRSGPWTHIRWMVTSETPVSGSSARSRPRLKNGPASLGVLWTGGMAVRRSNGGLMTTSWQGASAAGTTTGGTALPSASRRSKARRRGSLPRSSAVRSRLARIPATTRMSEPLTLLNIMAGPIFVGGAVGVPDPTRR
jgi:hypothetical protein